MRRLLVALTLLSVLPIYVHAQHDRRDGNWWTGQTADIKLDYIVGFFDGMELGYDFSYWGMIKDTDKGVATPCMSASNKSFNEHNERYIRGVSNYQLVDGLDTFYKDFRNRRITVTAAVWLVLNEIAGKPQNQMDKMIENYRKNAVKTN
jgi:hypothetical protein